MKGTRFDRPLQAKSAARVELVMRAEQVQICGYCNRLHLGECWRKIKACFRYGTVGHKISKCPLIVEPGRDRIQGQFRLRGLVNNLLGVVVRCEGVMVVFVVREHQTEVRVRLRLGSQLWSMWRGTVRTEMWQM